MQRGNKIKLMKRYNNTQYIIYRDGRIYNCNTKRFIKPTIKEFNKNTNKRKIITLYINGKQKTYLYYRILAGCFIPNPLNLTQINHIDGNSLNDELSNLEWSTCLNNNLHAINTGLRPTKLNKQIADEIRNKYKNNNITHKELAKQYNVGTTIISKILNNISWK